jgi:hypothetical protein
MKASKLGLVIGVPAITLAAGALLLTSLGAPAADHLDPPGRADPLVDPRPDAPADLADVYAFFDADNVVFAVTFGGPAATSLPAFYDRDVLYTLHLSNDGDPATTEFPVRIRFGFDGTRPGVQVTGLPGKVTVQGPVETDLQQNSILVRAGLFDDPFFFDSQGLRESRQSGTIRFSNQRSFFDGKNITAVIIQMPRALIQNGNNRVHVWSQTGRIGGQL